jgi:hypothetical protein
VIEPGILTQAIRHLVCGIRSAGAARRTGPKDAAAPRSRLANDPVVTKFGPHPVAGLRGSVILSRS